MTEKAIQIKYHDHEMAKLEKHQNGDWIDLRSTERVEMKAGEFKIISLGVSMKLPEGYEAHILPRSSTYRKFGLIMANSMGVVDNSYAGDNDIWGFPAIAMRDTAIEKGDRICQFRIIEQMPSINFEEVEHLDSENRGGFGSTGVK